MREKRTFTHSEGTPCIENLWKIGCRALKHSPLCGRGEKKNP